MSPKVQSDIGAVAQLLSKITDIFRHRQKNKEKRDLKTAARSGQLGFNRALKLYLDLVKDKTFMKHKRKFDKNII